MRRNVINRRAFLAGTGATAGAVALGACGGGDGGGGQGGGGGQAGGGGGPGRKTLRLAGGDTGLPSPFTYIRGGGYVQMSYVYDPLLWNDVATGKLRPWLASGYQRSEDGTRYTFQLRDGVRWQDGRPVTPEDVVFTYEYYANNTSPPTVIVQPVPAITDIRVTGERSVEFRLKNPTATFLNFGGAAAVPIAPKHVWQSVKNPAKASDPKLVMGCGPYKLQSYTPGRGAYSYTAYNKYYFGKPVITGIESIPVDDQLSALKAGELDQAGASGVRPQVLAPFQQDPYQILEAPPGSSTDSLYWNLDKGGALADPQFRHACALALNREEMVRRLFGGNGVVGNPGWIPPESPWYVKVEQYEYDRAAAQRTLERAGYTQTPGDGPRTTPDGQPLSFSLLVQNDPIPPALDLIVRDLAAVGVEVKPQPVDTPTFNARVNKGNTQMSIIGSGGMNSDLAPDYLRLVYSTKTELTQHAQGYDNPRVTRLCDEQLATLDRGKRMDIVAEIQRLVARDLPLLPLFYPDSFTIVNTNSFNAWSYTPGGVAGVIPTVNNKGVFITGKKTGV